MTAPVVIVLWRVVTVSSSAQLWLLVSILIVWIVAAVELQSSDVQMPEKYCSAFNALLIKINDEALQMNSRWRWSDLTNGNRSECLILFSGCLLSIRDVDQCCRTYFAVDVPIGLTSGRNRNMTDKISAALWDITALRLPINSVFLGRYGNILGRYGKGLGAG